MHDLCADRILDNEDRFVGRDGHRFHEFWECDKGSSPVYRSGELKGKEIEGWLREGRVASGPIKSGLRVLLSPKPAGKPTSGKLPYTRQTYQSLVRAWRIPPLFLRVAAQKLSMVTRCSVASHIPAFKDPGDGEDDSDKADNIEISVPSDARCLIIRGDADWTWDYALYLTHDPKTKTTFVLVVGLTAVEIDLVRSYMYSLANNASHTSTIIDEAPLQTHRLLLPILLLDLAIDDTASLLKIRAKLLSQIQQQTGMDRFNSLRNTTFGKRSSGVHERHWERQELDLDGIMLRLTCLNDWVAAQRGFVALQGRVVDVVTGMLDGKKTVKGGEEDTMAPTPYAANSFRERLAFIQESLVAAEQKCVYLERSIGAQVQTIYSLIGQKDNRLNISAANASCQIALDSRRIAILTRRDSTDMRIIAAVTLIFLPGTFVATVFSTGMFDWGNGDPNASPSDAAAEGGEGGKGRTVSSYIWVYFMMTGILTFLVLVAWVVFSWVQNRKMVRRFGFDVDGINEEGFDVNGNRRNTEISTETAMEARRLVRESTIWREFERWMEEARGNVRWWGKPRKDGAREDLKNA